MALALAESLADLLFRADEEHVVDRFGRVLLKIMLIRVFERRAGQDNVFAAPVGLDDAVPQRVEPWQAVRIGERDATLHLFDVGRRMEIVGVDEGPTDLAGKDLTHRRFAGARDSHQDQDHGRPPATRWHAAAVR